MGDDDEVYELGLGVKDHSRVVEKGKQRPVPLPAFAPAPWQYQAPTNRVTITAPPRTRPRKAD